MTRLTGIMLDSFLDGFTGAGMFTRLRLPGSPTHVIHTLPVNEHQLQREYRYATGSLVLGFVSSLFIVGGFTYLVMDGHPMAASGLLSTTVILSVFAFIRTRFKK